MNPIHRNIIKGASLRDKEAQHRLVALYYDTPVDDRPELLKQMVAESQKTAGKLKELELQKLEEEERTIGAIVDAAEEAQTEREAGEAEEGDGIVRGEGSERDDNTPGEGGDAGGSRGPALPDDAPRLQLP